MATAYVSLKKIEKMVSTGGSFRNAPGGGWNNMVISSE
jgi:hypothetical protein